MSAATSALFDKVYGCLAGGALGDAMGGVTEMMHYSTIEKTFGEITEPRNYGTSLDSARFDPNEAAGRYTDDTRLKHLIVDLIVNVGGQISSDEFGHHLREHLAGWYFTPVVNSFHKIASGSARPRDAGRGNMGSNSTAMAIAPIGVVNAGNPRAAARDAYDVASVIHEGYSRDAAACIAAGVASAFDPGNAVEDVIADSLRYLDRGNEIAPLVEQAVTLAKTAGGYPEFRAAFYDQMTLPWPQVDLTGDNTPQEGFYDTAEPRETIPASLALFFLAAGDPRAGIIGATNFGRDSDTIGSIVGGLCGAFTGIDAIPTEWVEVLDRENDVTQHSIALRFTEALVEQLRHEEKRVGLLGQLSSPTADRAVQAEVVR